MPGLKLAIYGIFNYYFQLETILNWALIGARALVRAWALIRGTTAFQFSRLK